MPVCQFRLYRILNQKILDVILVCVGRRPYTDGLGLESVGIEVNKQGQIPVDDNFQVRSLSRTKVDSYG